MILFIWIYQIIGIFKRFWLIIFSLGFPQQLIPILEIKGFRVLFVIVEKSLYNSKRYINKSGYLPFDKNGMEKLKYLGVIKITTPRMIALLKSDRFGMEMGY